MKNFNLNDKAEFNEQFRPQILEVNPKYKIPLICMNPGQEIQPHPSGTGVFYIVSGKGVMTIDGKEIEVASGEMVLIDEGESRGIRATENMTAFAVHIND
jgi:quercetin dioxygenase-like cupin family protein